MIKLSLLISLFLLTLPLQAKNLYVFVGTDTLSNVKSSCQEDGKRVIKALNEIGNRLEMDVKLTSVTGKNLTPENLEKWLKEIKPTTNDVIYFHFSGHGNRSKNKSTRWPSMFFTSTKKHVSLRRVIDVLKSKKARLSLILCDCCNNTPVGRKLASKKRSKIPTFTFTEHSQNVDALFRKTKGLIVASASTPGSLAWNTSEGGIFTTAFLYSLQMETLKSAPNWKAVFKQTYSLCEAFQKPQVELSVTAG
jgi:hypothetical protein